MSKVRRFAAATRELKPFIDTSMINRAMTDCAEECSKKLSSKNIRIDGNCMLVMPDKSLLVTVLASDVVTQDYDSEED